MAATVYDIPPGAAFLELLARGLMARAGGAPEGLAEMTVLLPSRRACRALAEHFLELVSIAEFLVESFVWVEHDRVYPLS